MSIGQQLKVARQNKKLTQEEVAQAVFVSRQSISNWENDKTYPDIITIIKLSDLYQISLDDLLKGSDAYMKHLDESTNLVKSNKKVLRISFIIVALILLIMALSAYLPLIIRLSAIFTLAILFAAVIYYQIIKRF